MPADTQTFDLPNDSSHKGRRYRMASVSERDEWAKVFPFPMPATHRLVHRWTDDMTLEVCVVPVTAEPPADPIAMHVIDLQLTEHGKQFQTALHARETRRAALDAMKDADLQTLAVEKGVAVTKELKKSKALLVAAVIEAGGKK